MTEQEGLPDPPPANEDKPLARPPVEASLSSHHGVEGSGQQAKYRVLLQECEIHPTDIGDSQDPFGATFEVNVAVGEFGKNWTVRRRLVYVDTFTL